MAEGRSEPCERGFLNAPIFEGEYQYICADHTYEELTFSDRNPIKRWLQRQRLRHALTITKNLERPRVILDFGAGNGELCKFLANRYPTAKIICYEPSPDYMAEARSNLAGLNGIEFLSDMSHLADDTVDLVFCLEVFEHLPTEETLSAFKDIQRALKDDGSFVIGVPVEVGFPALYKGLFRLIRRYGADDAKPKDILACVIGVPPSERRKYALESGKHFYFTHVGFDYRQFRILLADIFDLHNVSTSPFPLFGTFFNPEVYFVSSKRK